jgi:hypothetical protein
MPEASRGKGYFSARHCGQIAWSDPEEKRHCRYSRFLFFHMDLD